MQTNKIIFVKCGVVLSFLLIVCYGIRHRQRIVEEIDATYRCYDSWKRNSNLDRIITLEKASFSNNRAGISPNKFDSTECGNFGANSFPFTAVLSTYKYAEKGN